MDEILKNLYLSINEHNIKNRIDSKYWIYSNENVIVKEDGVNKRYIKVLFFNREFNENSNLMRLYLTVNGKQLIQEHFTIVSKYQNNNIMGFILPIDLAESGDEVVIDGYIIDGNRIDVNGEFVEKVPEIIENERVLSYKEYIYQSDHINLITLPVLDKEKWMCSCGYINTNVSDRCQHCYQSKEDMKEILTFDYQETVLQHLMNRIVVNLNESIEKSVQKYCMAIKQKYNIDEKVSKTRIDINVLKNRQKKLLESTIYEYITNHSFQSYIKCTFKDSLENYLTPLTTELVGYGEIIPYLNMENLKKEYEDFQTKKILKKKKYESTVRKQLLLVGLIVCIIAGSIIGFKFLNNNQEISDDFNYGNRIKGRDLIGAKNADNRLYGWIDQNGEEKIAFKYSFISNFNDDGIAVVKNAENAYDFIDKEGKSKYHGNINDLKGTNTSIYDTAEKGKHIFWDSENHIVRFIELDKGIVKEYTNTDFESSWQSKYYFILNKRDIRTSDNDGESFVVDVDGNILYDSTSQPKIIYIGPYTAQYMDSRYIMVKSKENKYLIIDSSKNKTFEIDGKYDDFSAICIISKEYEYDEHFGTMNIPYEDLLFYGFKNNICYILDIYGNIKKEIEDPNFNRIGSYCKDYKIYNVGNYGEGIQNIVNNNFEVLLTDTGKENEYIEYKLTDNSLLVSFDNHLTINYYQIYDGKKKIISLDEYNLAVQDPCYQNNTQQDNCVLHHLKFHGYDKKYYPKEILERAGYIYIDKPTEDFNLFYVNENENELENLNDNEIYLSKATLYNAKTKEQYNINGFICGRLSKAVVFVEPTLLTREKLEYFKYRIWLSDDLLSEVKGKSHKGIINANGEIVVEARYNDIYEYEDYIVCCDDRNSYLLNKETYEIEKTYEGIQLLY